jgi:predicted small lipoprotein YifL
MTVRILTIVAQICVVTGAMGLAACGKKGPLEPPKAAISIQK